MHWKINTTSYLFYIFPYFMYFITVYSHRYYFIKLHNCFQNIFQFSKVNLMNLIRKRLKITPLNLTHESHLFVFIVVAEVGVYSLFYNTLVLLQYYFNRGVLLKHAQQFNQFHPSYLHTERDQQHENEKNIMACLPSSSDPLNDSCRPMKSIRKYL